VRSLHDYYRRIVEVYQREGRGATYRDFEGVASHDWIRHVFSRLRRMGLIEKVPNSYPAEYVPVRRPPSPGLEGPQPQKRPRPPWSLIEEVLEKMLDEPFTIHDIQCTFVCPEIVEAVNRNPERFKADGWKFTEENKQWQTPKYRWHGRRRWIFARLNPTGVIQVVVQSSDDPIRLDDQSILDLIHVLGDFRNWLLFKLQVLAGLAQGEAGIVPPPAKWTVVQWHFGKDALGISEVSGIPVNITLRDFCDGYVRLYLKSVGEGKVRLERIEKNPSEKPLGQVLFEGASLSETIKALHDSLRLNIEIRDALHEFALQLRTHLAVLDDMRRTLREMAEIMKEFKGAGGEGDGGGGSAAQG
jgi:hypothetical protein